MSSLIDDAGVWRLQATGGTAKLVSEGGVWRLKPAAPSLADLVAGATHLWYLADGLDQINPLQLMAVSGFGGGSFGAATQPWASGRGSVTEVGTYRGLLTPSYIRTDAAERRSFEAIIELEAGFGDGVLALVGAEGSACHMRMQINAGNFKVNMVSGAGFLDTGVSASAKLWYVGMSVEPTGWTAVVAPVDGSSPPVLVTSAGAPSVGPWTSYIGLGYSAATQSTIHRVHVAMMSAIELTTERASQWVAMASGAAP